MPAYKVTKEKPPQMQESVRSGFCLILFCISSMKRWRKAAGTRREKRDSEDGSAQAQ